MSDLYNDYTPDNFEDLPTLEEKGLTRLKVKDDKLVIVTRQVKENIQEAPIEQALVDLIKQKESMEAQVAKVAEKIAEIESLIEANRKK